MSKERIKAVLWASLVTGVLTRLIVLGSKNLTHFDAVLMPYTVATLFAAFGVTFRYVLWLQRPATAMYWNRGWRLLGRMCRPKYWLSHGRLIARQLIAAFVFNRFIWRRGRQRWAAHWLSMWGCLIAAAITFPLVFGWVYFATVPDRLDHYRVYVFDYPTITFPVDSLFAFMVFHGLVWSSLMVVAGVLLALHRRLRDEGAAALQQFHDDMLPLLLLFAVAATGLMLTASYTWLKGYAYDFLAILHAVAVIITLLWLPFGKLFHVFQRSAQVGVLVYREAGRLGDQARCRRCQEEFASQMHVDDLIEVERQLGYRYEVDHPDCDHYQRICPRCRRLLLALAQGARWQLFPQPRREEHREAAVGARQEEFLALGSSSPLRL